MTEPGSSKARLAELDALRGLAAVSVVLFHYTVQAPIAMPGIKTIALHAPWGEYGVQLFFAISGFVILMTLERTSSGLDFAFARFTRLYPAYWAGLCFTTLAVHFLGAQALTQSPEVVAINLTMLQGFLYVPSVDGVYWSLGVELAFYGCMWALWRLDAFRRIEAILIVWIALRLFWEIVPFAPTIAAKLLLVDHIAFFAIGIAAYRVRAGERRWSDQAPLLFLGLGFTAAFDGSAPALAYVCATAIFVAMAAGRLRFLDRPGLLWLGSLSYPLYLVHQNIGYAIIAALEAVEVPAWLTTAAALAVALSLAQFIRDLVERPALQRLRTWRKSRAMAGAV